MRKVKSEEFRNKIQNKECWRFALRLTKSYLRVVKDGNQKLCDVYDQKGYCLAKALNVRDSKKYRNRKDYKIKMVTKEEAIADLERIIKFLRGKLEDS